jgi:hypothetical protein
MATVPHEKDSVSESGEHPDEERMHLDELRHDRILGVLILVGLLAIIGVLVWLGG